MPKVTYISHDGRESVFDVEPGMSIMRGALNHGVSGIYAECGGQTMCATCHVYVDDADLGKFPAVGEDEDEMLEATACDREHNSRLSCGLFVGEADVVVRIPEAQR